MKKKAQHPTAVKSEPLTAEEVMKRWGITDAKLKLLIRVSGLPAYNKFEKTRVEPAIYQFVTLFRLPFFYFKSADIEKFETNHPELLSEGELAPTKSKRDFEYKAANLRPDQRHKERCRALAALMWKRHPDDTIADIAKSDDIAKIGCEGKEYAHDTIRNWIKDLCPNPKRGRPKLS